MSGAVINNTMCVSAPQSVDHIIYGNEESRLRIADLVSGAEPLPAHGKSAVLLYGVWGTGKTTLARLLPSAIEQGRWQRELVMPEQLIECQQGHTGPQVMQMIAAQLSRVSLNRSGLHYLVIDEVDNLSKAAQQSLKSALNTQHAMFVLTTNHISQLDRGLLDRCVLVEMNAASVSQLAPIARAVAAAGHVVLNDTQLQHLITACNGSLRNIITNTARWARRQGQVSDQVIT